MLILRIENYTLFINRLKLLKIVKILRYENINAEIDKID